MLWLLLTIASIILLFYLYVVKQLQYWKNLQVPQYSVAKILKDLLASFIPTQATIEYVIRQYNDFPDKRYFGCYQLIFPSLFVRDPELIKQITIKDFDHFTDRIPFFTEETEPTWGKNLIFLTGEKWKDIRIMLSPSFTGLKLKIMCPLISNCIKQFLDYLEKNESQTIRIEAKDVFKKLGCDIIATSAFGIQRNSFEDPNNDFFLMATKMINLNFATYMRILFKLVFPKLSNIFNVHIMDEKVTRFFGNIILENMKARETQGIVRPDMIQLLIEAKQKTQSIEGGGDEDEGGIFKEIKDTENRYKRTQLTDDYIVGQALIFFFAGYEGLSGAMSFLAYELAVNPEVQERLYEEIEENIDKFGMDPSYENLMKMKYLDMVVAENLRKALITPVIDRVCTKPYTIQPKYVHEKPLHLKVGDSVVFSSSPIQRDPKYFPNPDRFDPERFSDKNKSEIAPGTYLPFGVGPRYCVGTRFAQMEIKLVFYYIVANFKIVAIDKTPIPLRLAKQQFTINAEGGFWVGLQKRKG